MKCLKLNTQDVKRGMQTITAAYKGRNALTRALDGLKKKFDLKTCYSGNLGNSDLSLVIERDGDPFTADEFAEMRKMAEQVVKANGYKGLAAKPQEKGSDYITFGIKE